MFVSTRTQAVLGGRKNCACFRNSIPFFDIQDISMVKRLQQSTAFCFEHFVIDSLPLMGRYFCKQISPFWLDNRYVHCAESVTKLDDA